MGPQGVSSEMVSGHIYLTCTSHSYRVFPEERVHMLALTARSNACTLYYALLSSIFFHQHLTLTGTEPKIPTIPHLSLSAMFLMLYWSSNALDSCSNFCPFIQWAVNIKSKSQPVIHSSTAHYVASPEKRRVGFSCPESGWLSL